MSKKSQLPTAILFDEISSYWTEIAQVNNTEKQLSFVKTNVNQEGKILDEGCGSGRHTIALCKAGYKIVGLDISTNLLRIAKKKAIEAELDVPLVRADMRCLPFQSNSFVAVTSLDSSFGYLPSEDDDTLSFQEIARTLDDKGLFLLDVFNRERLKHRYRKRLQSFSTSLYKLFPKFPTLTRLFKWKEYPSFYLLQKRKVTKDGEKLWDTWVFRNKKTGAISISNHVARLYKLSELRAMLEHVGLLITHVEGEYDGQEYSEKSSRLIILAQKH